MKKLLVLFFLVYSSFMFAQNYKTINPNRALYFTDSMTNIFAIKIDSIDIVSNDTNYYSFKTLRPDSAPTFPWDSCRYYVDDSWMGRKVIIKPNGYNVFINENYDSIFVNTQANLGDTFLLYTYLNNDIIKATVTSIDTSTVLGILDTVKTYSLFTNNNSFTLSPAEIKIGKESGLINMFSFFKFPKGNKSLYYNNYPIYSYAPYWYDYTLVGKSNPKIGITKLTNREVYNYDIGDEFSIEHIDHDFGDIPPLNYRRIENKYYSANGDTVFYEIERHIAYYSIVPFPPDFHIVTTYELEDTVLIYITNLDEYVTNAYPEQHHYKDSKLYNHYYSTLNIGSCSGVSYVREGSLILQYYPLNDMQPYLSECFIDAFEPAGISTIYQTGAGIVIKGSRGPNDGQNWTETTSYQKNGVTCGTILTEITEVKKDYQNFSIYPNPTSGYFNYRSNSIEKVDIQVLDISGKIVLDKIKVSANGNINISSLNSGIYFVKATSNNGISTIKMIVN